MISIQKSQHKFKKLPNTIDIRKSIKFKPTENLIFHDR